MGLAPCCSSLSCSRTSESRPSKIHGWVCRPFSCFLPRPSPSPTSSSSSARWMSASSSAWAPSTRSPATRCLWRSSPRRLLLLTLSSPWSAQGKSAGRHPGPHSPGRRAYQALRLARSISSSCSAGSTAILPRGLRRRAGPQRAIRPGTSLHRGRAPVDTVSRRISEVLHVSSIAVYLRHGRSFGLEHCIGVSDDVPKRFEESSSTVRNLARSNQPATLLSRES